MDRGITTFHAYPVNVAAYPAYTPPNYEPHLRRDMKVTAPVKNLSPLLLVALGALGIYIFSQRR